MGTISRLDNFLPTTPAESIGLLYNELSAAGVRHLYLAGDSSAAVISIRRGLTVWCVGGLFRWLDDLGAVQTHRADDPAGLVLRLGLRSSSAHFAA